MSTHSLIWPTTTSAVMDGSDRFTALYTRHRDRVYRWALRYSAGDAAFAEDVTQDVFIRLMDRLSHLEDVDALEGWLYRVTANRCLSKLRRRSLGQKILNGLGFGPTPQEGSEARLEARDDLRRVLAALRDLPDRERVVMTMLHQDGLSQTEIARTLGLSKGYVSKLVTRATQTLRSAGWEVEA